MEARTNFVLEGLEWYKNSQVKTYNITKLTAKQTNWKVATVYSTEIN